MQYSLPLICFFIMLILDITWITVMTPMYSSTIRKVQQSPLSVKFGGAFIAYILMFVSLVIIVFPAIIKDTTTQNKFVLALKYGGAFGFVAYGIYNATNYATLKNYDIRTAIIDTLWGTTVYTISVYLALKLVSHHT